MKCIQLLLSLGLLVGGTTLAAQDGAATPLLYDAALTGWHVIIDGQGEVAVDEQTHFVWEDSLLHALPAAQAGSKQAFAALVTDSVYGAYRLHVEYKWGEKKFAPRNGSVRDAGILFHVYDTSIFWPSGLECQIQEGDTGDAWLIGARATSTLQDDTRTFSPDGKPERRAGERYIRFARSFSWEQPGWNTVELDVDGDTASFYVNGHLVNTITKTQQAGPESGVWVPLREGRIALQAEGAEILYRNVLISPR